MPVAQPMPLPGHDGSDGVGPQPPLESLMPWIALAIALTAIASTWMGKSGLPLFVALAAWAGHALARQYAGRLGLSEPMAPVAPPHGPLFRLVSAGPAPAESPDHPAPSLRLVTRAR